MCEPMLRRERVLGEVAGAAEMFCYCDPQLAESRMRARHAAGSTRSTATLSGPSIIGRAARLAATVTPLGLGAALIKVDTGQPGAPARAVAAVTATLGR